MKLVFTNNHGLIDRKHFFKATSANQLLFKNQIDAYPSAGYGHLDPNCQAITRRGGM
ncbi:MAG: hypothetical protein LBF82_00660 [Lactobacillales bacterium]|jgi:hypothetical protein|nr:hypothetical protein [Lactobacillales bacterium]